MFIMTWFSEKLLVGIGDRSLPCVRLGTRVRTHTYMPWLGGGVGRDL